MASTRKSVAYSSAANIGSMLVSLVLMVIVARWLEPAEIGAFAVAYAVIAILEPLRQFKIIDYVIQAKDMDTEIMRSVQFGGLVTTGVVMVITLFAAVALQAGFGSQQVGVLLLVMAVSFPIKALAQPAIAVLSREMRFGTIAGIRITGMIFKAAVTIGALFLGFGAEALAFGIVAEIVCEIAAIAAVQRKFALPVPGRAHTGPIWNFCGKVSGAQLLNRSVSSSVDLVVGSFLGLAAAGYFNRANVLVATFRSSLEKAIAPVAIAVFAKNERIERSGVKTAYLSSLGLLTGVSWPALTLFIVLTEPIILLVYGDNWISIIPIAKVLAISGIVYAATALAQPLLASIGAVDVLLRRELYIQLPRIAILLIAVQFNLMAVAWGTVAIMAIITLVNQHMVGQQLGISHREYAAQLLPSVVITTACTLPTWLVTLLPAAQELGSIALLCIAAPVAATGWLIAVWLVHPPLREEITALARYGTQKFRQR
jgi:O-antigen/teichoic acid export membrane protein